MKLSLPIFVAASSGISLTAAANLDIRGAVDDCLTNAKVPIFAAGSADRKQGDKSFNTRVPFTTGAYAVPTTVQHVQDAVLCGSKYNMKVTAKSGGHSYGTFGLGGENGHLIIDLKKMKSVVANATSHTAVIGAGGRLGDIATALYSQGKQGMAHGTCPGVGVGGLSLHGGYGLSSRKHGLTLDNMLSAQVVLANGSAVTASTTQNPDLFWGLRGAGASFGIVTSFTFKTFDAPESNVVYSYSLNYNSATDVANQISALQDFTISGQPAELDMRLFLQNNMLTLTGVYYGSRSDYDKVMAPLLAKLSVSNGWGTSISTKGWIDTLSNFAYGSLPQADPYDNHETFYAKSLMTEKLSAAAIKALSDYFYNTARSIGRSYYLLIDFHGGASSAISAVPANATSYAHRSAILKMQFYDIASGSQYQSSWFPFMQNWVQAILNASPGNSFGMYINYADTQLNSTEAHTRYWRDHYPQLVTYKKKWDPANLFYGPQLVGS